MIADNTTEAPGGWVPGETDFADLARFFGARSVAVIGATRDAGRIGGRPLQFLARSGYDGAVHPVNPKYESIGDLRCHATAQAIGEPVDLALIAVPAAAVPAAVDDCARAGIPTAIVFSSGFAELGAEGRAAQDALVERARAGGVRLLGPNSLGAVSAGSGLVATFSTLADRHERLRPGRVGFISQSGALGVFIYAMAQEQGVGFSRFVSIGNEGDLDVADFLAYMALDDETAVIGGYLESIGDGERLLAAAELARERGKPVCFLKTGRSPAGIEAAQSHTGALAGADAIYDAAFRQAGVVRAADPQGLIDFLELHARGRPPAQPGIAMLSISGGAGVWSADRLADFGIDPATLEPSTVAELTEILPPFGSARNPVDATGQILNRPELFGRCLEAVLADPGVGTLIVLLGLQDHGGEQLALEIATAAARHPGATIAVCWLAAPDAAVRVLRDAGLPLYDDMARCVDVVARATLASAHLARRRPARAVAAGEAVPPRAADTATEHGAKAFLARLGIDVPRGRLCRTREEAVEWADGARGPVALKGQVRGLGHKSEHGLVRLGVAGADGVAAAFDAISAAMAASAAAADVEGVLVEEMVLGGVELVVGCLRDATWGSTVMVGLGGIATELLGDVAFRIAPIDAGEARAMIAETRAARLLDGFRGGPRHDVDAAAAAIARLSEVLVAGDGEIGEIEINPLLVRVQGAVALDALVVPVNDRRDR